MEAMDDPVDGADSAIETRAPAFFLDAEVSAGVAGDPGGPGEVAGGGQGCDGGEGQVAFGGQQQDDGEGGYEVDSGEAYEPCKRDEEGCLPPALLHHGDDCPEA
ncbi:hypothetical protein CIP107563_00238 [Corynebacterium diphtheriae]|nr:hypothetical protein CIP107563_00238 [Corynebacterium diphtheriae]